LTVVFGVGVAAGVAGDGFEGDVQAAQQGEQLGGLLGVRRFG